jgi:hypothetical protein
MTTDEARVLSDFYINLSETRFLDKIGEIHRELLHGTGSHGRLAGLKHSLSELASTFEEETASGELSDDMPVYPVFVLQVEEILHLGNF